MTARKVSSTPDDYSRGIAEGVAAALEDCGAAPDDLVSVVHATTVATNTILEQKGARTGLITTRGFRDVLEMRRLRIPVMYDLQYEKPPPLVPRRMRREVDERIGPDGAVRRRLDAASLDGAISDLRREGAEAVAVSLLHAYANPDHERQVAERLRRCTPGRCPHHLLVGHPAGNPGVRADQHRRRQRLHRAGGPTLHGDPARPAADAGRHLPGSHHAVERRRHVRRLGQAQARLPRRIRPRGGRDGLRPARPRHRARQPDLLRHGRDHGQGVHDRGRTGGQDDRIRGGRGHQPVQQADQGRRLPGQAALRGRLRDRRRRRQHLPGRRRGPHQRGAAERRCRSGSGVLRPRRNGPHADRCPGRRRLPEPGVPGGRQPAAGHGQGARDPGGQGGPAARAPAWRRPRTACSPSPAPP